MIKCRFCDAPILRGAKRVCKKCKSIYHSECWYINGRCTTKGCLCTDAHTVESKRETPVSVAQITDKPSGQQFKTRYMDTKTKFLSSQMRPKRRIRWERLAIIASIPVGIILLLLLINFILNSSGFGKVDKLYSSGVYKMERSQYQEASVLFEQALQIKPDYPKLKPKLIEVYFKLVKKYKDEYKYNEALEVLNKISELSSKDRIKAELIDIYTLWGENLLNQGSYQSAVEKFDCVLDIAPDNSNAKQKKVETLINMVYTPDYDVKEEQMKIIFNDKECREKLGKDGVKIYAAKCMILKADVNKDNSREIIVAGEDKDSESAAIDIYSITEGKPSLIKSIDTSGNFISKIGTVDLNADKQTEVFTDWTEAGTTKLGFTVIIFAKEETLSEKDTQQISSCPVTFEDINKDGTTEIIAKKQYEDITIDDKEVFIPSIYQWQNYEFVDVTAGNGDYYKKAYILPMEEKLKTIPKADSIKKAEYEDKIRRVIQKFYNTASIQYDSKSGKKTPEETIQANFDYINQHDFYKAYLLRSAKRRELKTFESFYQDWKYNESIKIDELTLGSQDDNKAEVKVVFEATDQVTPGKTRTETYKGSFYLVKEGELWYLEDSNVK